MTHAQTQQIFPLLPLATASQDVAGSDEGMG